MGLIWRCCVSDLLTSADVRRMFGGISRDTLRRWIKRREFPEPDRVVGGMRYWTPAQVDAVGKPKRKAKR